MPPASSSPPTRARSRSAISSIEASRRSSRRSPPSRRALGRARGPVPARRDGPGLLRRPRCEPVVAASRVPGVRDSQKRPSAAGVGGRSRRELRGSRQGGRRSGAQGPRGGASGADRRPAPRSPCSTIGRSSAGGSIAGSCPRAASSCSTSRPCGSAIEATSSGRSVAARPGRAHRALLVQRAQRRRAQRSLAERLRFETLLSDLSKALASCPDAEIDQEIETGLRRIVEDLGTDRASLWALDDRRRRGPDHAFMDPAGVAPMRRSSTRSTFPGPSRQIRQGHVRPSPAARRSVDEAPIDRQSLAQIGTRSTAVAPLVEGGVVVGGLSVGTAFWRSAAGPTS